MTTVSTLVDLPDRLRASRRGRGMSLVALSRATGISTSTLSRLETGRREPTLALLVPIASALECSLTDLVPSSGARRPEASFERFGMTFVPLAGDDGDGVRAYRVSVPGDRDVRAVVPRVHDGFGWIFVLTGRLRIVLGGHDLVLERSEIAEFDTRATHAFGSADGAPVELLALFASDGTRPRVRARTSTGEARPRTLAGDGGPMREPG